MDKLLFGNHLQSKGIISEEQLQNALTCQKEINSVFGEIAVAKKLLTLDDVNKILEIQEKSKDKKFGEIALALEKLNIKQVDSILKLQKKSNLQFGEIMCFLGIISYDRLIEELKEYKERL